MSGDPSSPAPRRARRRNGGKCPTCGAASQLATRPFCSTRCAEVDLGRWLQGSYRIPTQERPSEGEPAPEEDEQ
ncbi:MAG: DNA gyrase inhibitor YacG [Rhodovibrionaceae bacterium]